MANLAASVNTSASDGGLKECLRLGNVPQGVIDDLTDPTSADSLRTLKNLLYYPHSEADPMPCLLNLLVGCRGYEDRTSKATRMMLTNLRDAWEYTRKVHDQQSVAQDNSCDLDKVLDKGTLKDLRAKWKTGYDLDLHSRLAPDHQTISFFHRMWQTGKFETVAVERIKSMDTIKEPKRTEKKKFGEGVSMVFNEPDIKDVKSLSAYYWLLRTMAYAWAWACSDEVPLFHDPGKKARFAPLDVNLEYADEAFAMALTIPRNAVQWLRAKDLHTRGIMTKKLLDGWTQGEALRHAMDKTELIWGDKRGMGAPPEGEWTANKKGDGKGKDRNRDFRRDLQLRSRSRDRRGRRGDDRRRSSSVDRRDRDRDRDRDRSSTGNKGFAPTLPGNKKPCLEWNMKGKCSAGANCPLTHACNKILLKGGTCNRTDHPACRHDPRRE